MGVEKKPLKVVVTFFKEEHLDDDTIACWWNQPAEVDPHAALRSQVDDWLWDRDRELRSELFPDSDDEGPGPEPLDPDTPVASPPHNDSGSSSASSPTPTCDDAVVEMWGRDFAEAEKKNGLLLSLIKRRVP